MSPEFRVEIVVPYTYVVKAENEEEAECKAWKLFEDDTDDYNHPATVESIERIELTRVNLDSTVIDLDRTDLPTPDLHGMP